MPRKSSHRASGIVARPRNAPAPWSRKIRLEDEPESPARPTRRGAPPRSVRTMRKRFYFILLVLVLLLLALPGFAAKGVRTAFAV